MKLSLLGGIVFTGAATLFAQAPASSSSSSSRPTAPAGSTSARTITLTGCVGGGLTGSDPMTLSNATVVPNSPAGSSAASPSPAPTSASAMRTAPAQPAATATYQLTGVEMSSWAGQRVQIVGSVVPNPSSGQPASSVAGATGTSGSSIMPEFRVQSVEPIGGPCPQ